MSTIQQRIINIKELEDDYSPNNDIFSEESEEVDKLKQIVYNDLELWERRLILLYAELSTYKALAETLGCSISSIAKMIKSIRAKIQEIYVDRYTTDGELR